MKKYEVWVTLTRRGGGRTMKQFFCESRAEMLAKLEEWLDKAVKIEVMPR